MTSDPKEKFSDRVDDYVKYRPSYPAGVLDALEAHCGLGGKPTVADVGSGTGIFTALLLERGYRVFAVEPNAKMRRAAEQLLSNDPLFQSVNGKAEETGLEPDSVDLVTSAQAFHWFPRDETKQEFRRILKPEGWLALVWNLRTTSEPFQKAYEDLLLRLAPEYKRPEQSYSPGSSFKGFFQEQDFQKFTFPNQQQFDYQALVGRTQSSSYVPATGSEEFERLLAELKTIFEDHAVDGQVKLDYETRLYVGRMFEG